MYHDRTRPQPGAYEPRNDPCIVFVTICTKDRTRWLAQQEVHVALVEEWRNALAWLVGRYVIMPDHIHLFASPEQLDLPMDNWVRFWKSQLTKRTLGCTGQWQARQWDTLVRTGESYAAKWEYVRNNPVRQGLVESAEDWPYQGELNVLPWWDH